MRRTDKQYLSSLIFMVALAIVFGGYFLYQKYSEKKDSAGADGGTKINILSIKKDDITEIEVKNSNSTFTLAKTNGKYMLKQEPTVLLDDVIVEKLAEAVSKLDAEKEIGKDIAEFSQFGLGVPAYTVQVKHTNDAVSVLEIGDKSPSGIGYYIKKKDDSTVYVSSVEQVDSLMVDKQKLRSKNVLTGNKEDVELVNLSNEDGVVFELAPDGKDGTKWTIKKPFEGKADDTEVAKVIDSAFDLKVSEFIGTVGDNLTEYGLDNPSCVLTIKTKGTDPVEVLIGKDMEQSQRYVMRKGAKEVLLIETNSLEFEKKTAQDLSFKSK